ncbi:MAG: DNA mismatch endonuclease Vsr [Bryobacteraceae bacterium]|nr:DNA mismatch endonuclease Vsr [Bryobacteraceae bacterium]
MDYLPPHRRSANMSQIRSRDTAPEMIVRRLVYAMGYRYRLHVAALPGKPDLVFTRLKKVIEVRGCFWHGHLRCIDSHIPKTRTEYWKQKLERNKQRDADNEKKLHALGWKVLTIWECQLADQLKVKKRLRRFLST